MNTNETLQKLGFQLRSADYDARIYNFIFLQNHFILTLRLALYEKSISIGLKCNENYVFSFGLEDVSSIKFENNNNVIVSDGLSAVKIILKPTISVIS